MPRRRVQPHWQGAFCLMVEGKAVKLPPNPYPPILYPRGAPKADRDLLVLRCRFLSLMEPFIKMRYLHDRMSAPGGTEFLAELIYRAYRESKGLPPDDDLPWRSLRDHE